MRWLKLFQLPLITSKWMHSETDRDRYENDYKSKTYIILISIKQVQNKQQYGLNSKKI